MLLLFYLCESSKRFLRCAVHRCFYEHLKGRSSNATPFSLCLFTLLLAPKAIKPIATAGANIMFCPSNGWDIIEYTKYAVEINKIPVAIPRKILLFISYITSLFNYVNLVLFQKLFHNSKQCLSPSFH